MQIYTKNRSVDATPAAQYDFQTALALRSPAISSMTFSPAFKAAVSAGKGGTVDVTSDLRGLSETGNSAK